MQNNKGILDDSDVVASATRKVANEAIGPRLVELRRGTLAAQSGCFTTLVIIYKCNRVVLEKVFDCPSLTGEANLLSQRTAKVYVKTATHVWERLAADIDIWREALHDKTSGGDSRRRHLRQTNLLGKPIFHLILVAAYLRLCNSGVSHKEACFALNKINWSITDQPPDGPDWHGVCMTPSYKITTKMVPLAVKIIAHMAGERMNSLAKEELAAEYKEHHWNPDKDKIQLPRPIKV